MQIADNRRKNASTALQENLKRIKKKPAENSIITRNQRLKAGVRILTKWGTEEQSRAEH